MKSPCTNICHIDPVAKVCIGCFRTLSEIECWSRYLDQQREHITNLLETRKNDYMGNIGKQP